MVKVVKQIKDFILNTEIEVDDNLEKAFGQEFLTKLAQALGQDIALTVTQIFKK